MKNSVKSYVLNFLLIIGLTVVALWFALKDHYQEVTCASSVPTCASTPCTASSARTEPSRACSNSWACPSSDRRPACAGALGTNPPSAPRWRPTAPSPAMSRRLPGRRASASRARRSRAWALRRRLTWWKTA